METLLPAIVQGGAVAVLAYLMLQLLGKQADAQREEMSALIERISEDQRSREAAMREQVSAVVSAVRAMEAAIERVEAALDRLNV